MSTSAYMLTSLIFCLIHIKESKQNLQRSTRILTLLTMSQGVNSEEIGTPTRIEESTSSEQSTNCCIVKCAKKIIDPRGPSGNWISLVLCVVSISVDPLFFYIPVIYTSCVELDKKLGIMAFVLRSAIDLFYVIYIYFQPQTRHDDTAPRYWLFGPYISYRSQKICIDLLAVFPLPQLVIIIIISEMEALEYYNAMKVLKYFVFFQFVPRVIRIYPLFKKATGTFGILGEVTWAKAAFNLYLYLLSGHVFGALWYFFGIERVMQCWKRICDCDSRSLGCDRSYDRPQNFFESINTFCSTKSEYSDYGIYQAVLDAGVTDGLFLPRFMFCVRWGLQSLSCFAQNLITSADVWENTFTISITIASLVLFVFLIGNMQLYLQSETSRSEEMKLKMREIQQWKPFKKLPDDLRQQVKEYQQHVWHETKGADIEELLDNLPKAIRRNVKRKICLDLLKKVPQFALMCDQHLNAMCERLKHVLYPDGTFIVREGDPVDEMLFIMHGKLLMCTMSSNDRDRNFGVYYSRGFCGEELLSSWALDSQSQSSSDLPISTKTIRTFTEVEAFALAADDLKDVFTKFKQCHPKHLLHPFRCHSLRRKHWAVCIIQAAWRHYRVKKLEKRRHEEEKRLQNAHLATVDRSSST